MFILRQITSLQPRPAASATRPAPLHLGPLTGEQLAPHEASSGTAAALSPPMRHYKTGARQRHCGGASPREPSGRFNGSVRCPTINRPVPSSPYFVPRKVVAKALIGLSDDGGEIATLTNSLAATDVAAVHSGYARHRPQLIKGGVRLFELQPHGRAPNISLLVRGARASTRKRLSLTSALALSDRSKFRSTLGLPQRRDGSAL